MPVLHPTGWHVAPLPSLVWRPRPCVRANRGIRPALLAGLIPAVILLVSGRGSFATSARASSPGTPRAATLSSCSITRLYTGDTRVSTLSAGWIGRTTSSWSSRTSSISSRSSTSTSGALPSLTLSSPSTRRVHAAWCFFLFLDVWVARTVLAEMASIHLALHPG